MAKDEENKDAEGSEEESGKGGKLKFIINSIAKMA